MEEVGVFCGRATGRAIPSLWGESRIVVRAWSRLGAGLRRIEGIKKITAGLKGCCQCMGC